MNNPSTKSFKGSPQTRKTQPKGHDQERAEDQEDLAQLKVDFETPMSPREQRFLELYFFSGEKITQHEAAKKAGYRGKTKQALCNTARRIIQKFESLTDPRGIFRQIGLGEAQVASRLLAMADDPTISASVRRQTLNTASKCLGLQRETAESVQGARIIICGPQPGEEEPGQAPPSREQTIKENGGEVKQPAQGQRPIAIVR
jgi:hypothetical protein